MSDVSGLEYHAPTDSLLLVLSDESKNDSGGQFRGRVRDRLFLTAEVRARDDIPQPEGIAMDNENNLYIVSEPNLFYINFRVIWPECG